MSLRNEIHGTNENANDLNNYVTQGVTTIHDINPNVLMIQRNPEIKNEQSWAKSFFRKQKKGRCRDSMEAVLTNGVDYVALVKEWILPNSRRDER